jgi:hypothetical protein
MSGTSLDGIDLAQIVLLRATSNGNLRYKIRKLFHTQPLVKQTALTLSKEDLAN